MVCLLLLLFPVTCSLSPLYAQGSTPTRFNLGGFNDLRQISTPSGNPNSGFIRVYAKTASTFCMKDYVGAETCFSAGSVLGSGTATYLPKFTGATTLGDSLLSDDGTTLDYAGTGGYSGTSYTSTGTAGLLKLPCSATVPVAAGDVRCVSGSPATLHVYGAADQTLLSKPLDLFGSAPAALVVTKAAGADPTTNNCVKWVAGGGVGDAGAACGAGTTTGVSLPNSRRWAYGPAPGTGTVFKEVGDNFNNTATGTPTSVAPTATASAVLNLVTTAATTGTKAGFRGLPNYRMGRNILYQVSAWPVEYTAERVWLAATDQTGTVMAAADDPAGNYMGFRASTVAGDTKWVCATKDNTTQTTADSGVTIVAGTQVDFQIYANDTTGHILFSINGAQVCDISTHLPTAGTNLWVLEYLETEEDVLKNLQVAWIYVESDK
jgi:hypothetical protein